MGHQFALWSFIIGSRTRRRTAVFRERASSSYKKLHLSSIFTRQGAVTGPAGQNRAAVRDAIGRACLCARAAPVREILNRGWIDGRTDSGRRTKRHAPDVRHLSGGELSLSSSWHHWSCELHEDRKHWVNRTSLPPQIGFQRQRIAESWLCGGKWSLLTYLLISFYGHISV